MVPQVLHFDSFFFAGVAGAGMSAIAQYLSGIGKQVSGSDRLFNQPGNEHTKKQLEEENITCYDQLEARINESHQVLVVSTAIESTNVEVAKANELNIPIVTRAQLLAQIVKTKKSIAIAGTSGKSTTAAMLFHLLINCGIDANLITGAGIVSLIEKGKIGNCYVGTSDWLIIEADESDGSLVQYEPAIGVLLSIDKDHKELSELAEIFATFKKNIREKIIVNQDHPLAKEYSSNKEWDFGLGSTTVGTDFRQEGFNIYFKVEGQQIHIPTIGKHNMENALACLAVAKQLGIAASDAAKALATYPGIYRRHQVLLQENGLTVIDDYAHNPAKVGASIRACKAVGKKLLAWFQPHGYGPTRFIRTELVEEIASCLGHEDAMFMSEIYYAGGTAVKNISAGDLIADLSSKGVQAFFVPDRKDLAQAMKKFIEKDTVILLMGARDPGLEQFAKDFVKTIRELQ